MRPSDAPFFFLCVQRQRAVGAAFQQARALNTALFPEARHSKRADAEARRTAKAQQRHDAAEQRPAWACDHGVAGCRICAPPFARRHAAE